MMKNNDQYATLYKNTRDSVTLDNSIDESKVASINPVRLSCGVPIVDGESLAPLAVIVIVGEVEAEVVVCRHSRVVTKDLDRPRRILQIARCTFLSPLFAIALTKETNGVGAAEDRPYNTLERMGVVHPGVNHSVEAKRRWTSIRAAAHVSSMNGAQRIAIVERTTAHDVVLHLRRPPEISIDVLCWACASNRGAEVLRAAIGFRGALECHLRISERHSCS